jgi:hypothetical protein
MKMCLKEVTRKFESLVPGPIRVRLAAIEKKIKGGSS